MHLDQYKNPLNKNIISFYRQASSFCSVIILLGLIASGCNLQSAIRPSATAPTSTTITKTITPEEDRTPTPVPSATIPVELSQLKGAEVRFIHPWSGEAEIELRQIINEFNTNNVWGINVNAERGGSITGTARAFIDSMVTSERINLVAISPEYLVAWNDGGYTIDLSPFLSNMEWGIQRKEKETYFQQVWDANEKDNILTGIPASMNFHILVYNQTWAKELGFSTIPETRDELLAQVCEAARVNNQDSNRDNDGTGGWIINSNSNTLLSWINAFKTGDLINQNPRDLFSQEETGNTFSYLRELLEKGCSWNSRVASPFTYFANRQTLVFSATLPDLLELEQTLAFTKNVDGWTILSYPGEDSPASLLATNLSYGISKTDAVHELASWLFVRWLTLPRNQARLAEASGVIPPTSAALALMSSFGDKHPWWGMARDQISDAVTLPASADWQKARPVLEDGFWQMMQPTPMPIPTLLYQMDETFGSEPQ